MCDLEYNKRTLNKSLEQRSVKRRFTLQTSNIATSRPASTCPTKPEAPQQIDSEEQIDVKTIAEITVKETKLKDVKSKFTGGVDGGRGWKGDVKNMFLDISKIKALG